jgi:hypothetical protein
MAETDLLEPSSAHDAPGRPEASASFDRPDAGRGALTEVAAQNGPAGSLLNFVAMAVKDPSIDVAKLDALLRMQREIVADDAREQFNRAFVDLQARLPRIKRNGSLEYPKDPKLPDGPKRKISRFMKFEDIDEAIRPLLEEAGFSQSWNTAPRVGDGGGLIVTHILRHRAGHSQETSLPIPLDTSGGKNNLQGYGSTLQYGKRYTMCAGLNIVAEGEDDDGKGGYEQIDDESVKRLSDLCVETKSDLNAFLKFMGVAGLPEITVRDYPTAVNALLAKKARVTT